MRNKCLIEALEDVIENGIYKRRSDGTRYYLLSREQIEEIIEALKHNE